MLDSDDAAYPLTIAACGEEFFVARSLDLVRRIEGAFGAIHPLSNRLKSYAVPLRDMAVLLDLMLADVPGSEGRPTRKAIEEWLMAAGIHVPSLKLADEVLHLIIGNEMLEKIVVRKKTAAPREGAVAPFAPTAVWPGPTGS